MITQYKFHKLCKYSTRLKKSFISNNSNDFVKYCLHLKYLIGNQIDNCSNHELDKLFNILINYINDNKYNIKKQVSDEYKQKIQ